MMLATLEIKVTECPDCKGNYYHYSGCEEGYHGQVITDEQWKDWQARADRRRMLMAAQVRGNEI